MKPKPIKDVRITNWGEATAKVINTPYRPTLEINLSQPQFEINYPVLTEAGYLIVDGTQYRIEYVVEVLKNNNSAEVRELKKEIERLNRIIEINEYNEELDKF